MEDVVIVSAARTPIGSFQGCLQDVSAVQLGSVAIKEALDRASLDMRIPNEVIMGNVLQAGLGQNPARQSTLAAGLPVETPAMTINKVCGSGLKAVHLAWQSVACGESQIVVAGGMESMSQAPYLLEGARSGYSLGHQTTTDSLLNDGLWCAIRDIHMGTTAENICDRYKLTREQLDQFAADSQRKTAMALKEGRFRNEMISVEIKGHKGKLMKIDTDEYPRETSVEQLAKLRPVFQSDGRVTAGNASGINDGAAALVIMSASKARELHIRPMARIRANAVAGVDPAYMGIGPVPAIRKALSKAGLSLADIDLIEANEAFAAQSLAVARELDIDPQKLNVNGGAIALGHPIGASGARILVTLLYEMERRNVRFGLAALCVGGGQGIATIIERSVEA